MAAKTARKKTITEEIQVAGHELLDRVKELLAEGRVRHIRVKSPTGDLYFELPLAVGVIGGAALAVASPWLAMAGSLAGLVASVKVEVIREHDEMVAVIEPMLEQDKPGAKPGMHIAGGMNRPGRGLSSIGSSGGGSARQLTAQKPARKAAAKKPAASSAKPKRAVASKRASAPAKASPARGKKKTTGRR
jgi:hypothetical protein